MKIVKVKANDSAWLSDLISAKRTLASIIVPRLMSQDVKKQTQETIKQIESELRVIKAITALYSHWALSDENK